MTADPLLIVGGAGYIGSHMVRRLIEAGRTPVVLDDLSSGRAAAVDGAELIVGDLGDRALLDRLFGERRFAGVMHFASRIDVGESVRDPAGYYELNVAGTIVLLGAMARHGVKRFVFSSSAAIFGEPETLPIVESHAARPVSPYGRTKWMIEQLLPDYHAAYGLHYGCLRYFNAAGAHPDGGIGECHDPETHLIPLVLQAAAGRRASITMYGDDYPTPDGSCIRDYVHVCDLAEAHLALLDALGDRLPFARFNLGSGEGYSVREVIETARRVTGRDIPLVSVARRPGDPAMLVADGTAAKQALGWKPVRSSLETIIADAWRWEKSHFSP